MAILTFILSKITFIEKYLCSKDYLFVQRLISSDFDVKENYITHDALCLYYPVTRFLSDGRPVRHKNNSTGFKRGPFHYYRDV